MKSKRKPPINALSQSAPSAPVNFASTVVPQGDGSFLLKPGKPVIGRKRLTLVEAGARAGLSDDTIRRLYDAGLVEGERPSMRKLFVYEDSLDAHLAATANQEYWSEHSRRRPYLAVYYKHGPHCRQRPRARAGAGRNRRQRRQRRR